MKTLLSALCILFFTGIAQARHTSHDKVIRIQATDGRALRDAAVVLLADSTTTHRVAIGDALGMVTLEDADTVARFATASIAGFAQRMEALDWSRGDTLTITLQPASQTIGETVVRSQRPLIEVKADRLVVNVENSAIQAGSTALEILARSPGVRVDASENISLKGKPGVTVMIDGKISPLSGTDLANFLKNMPAAQIAKIELISNPSARYDAAGTAGIINIQTRKLRQGGLNGSAQASYGRGQYGKGGTGFNMNYRKGQWNVQGSYNYAHRNGFNRLFLDRRFYAGSALLYAYDQNNFSFFPWRSHSASVGVDYSPTPRWTTGISASTQLSSFKPETANNSVALDAAGAPMYAWQTTGTQDNRYKNLALSGYLRHTIDTNGREISADVDYAIYPNNSDQRFATTYTTPDGAQMGQPYRVRSLLTGTTAIRSLKADYTQPALGGKLDVGIKTSLVTSDNEPLFYDESGGAAVLDTSRSNHFIYNENINAAYVNASRDWVKVSAQIGLRMEQTVARGEQRATGQTFDRNYAQLFPSLAGQYHLNPKHDLGATLSRRIERPDYGQLNPFRYFIDKTTYHGGNPYLKPALTYSAELSHTYAQRLVTSLSYSVTKDVMIEVIQPSDDEDSVTVQTVRNMATMRFFGLSGSYNFQFTKWWSNTTNFNAYYAFYEGNVANTALATGRPTFDLNTSNTFTLPLGIQAELSLYYQARNLYAFMDLNPVWMLNAGVQRSFLDKKLNIRLNAQDIFWKGYPSATSRFSGYQEDFIAQRDTRVINLSVSYRFGGRPAGAPRRRSGADEEKRRAGGGGLG